MQEEGGREEGRKGGREGGREEGRGGKGGAYIEEIVMLMELLWQ